MRTLPWILGASVLLSSCDAATYTPRGPVGLEVVHGAPPVVSLATTLDTALQVRVVDERGIPLSDVPVEWRVVAGDGSLTSITSTSDADGLASAQWQFNVLPGAQSVQAAVVGVDPVTFTTEARAFRAIQVTAGYGHGCALDTQHEAWCFGGDARENGGPPVVDNYRPVKVSGGKQFESIDAGDSFTCGTTADREVWCWGNNWGAVLGTSAAEGSATPLKIGGLPAT